MTARVAQISIAPVKGLRVVQPREVTLAADGVPGDRRFWLVDETGRMYGKPDGRLVQVRPEWDEAWRRLVLEFPNGDRLEGVIELGEAVTGVMIGRSVSGRRVLGPWEGALCAFLGRRLRLVWSDRALVDRHVTGDVGRWQSRTSGERCTYRRARYGRRSRLSRTMNNHIRALGRRIGERH